MADIPFWDQFTEGYEGSDYDPNPWGQVKIGAFRLPGICRVDGAAVQRIDVQKANGVDGGTLIERGYLPSEFDIDMTIWTPSHWSLWRTIRPQIYRPANKIDISDAKKRTATKTDVGATDKASLPVSHPALDDAGISACLIKSITLPRPGPDVGSMVITIKCVEHRAPVPKANANRRSAGVGKPDLDKRFEDHPARNKPKKPSEAGDGRPGGAPKVVRGSS